MFDLLTDRIAALYLKEGHEQFARVEDNYVE